MFASLAERFREEAEVGVPRRFSIGTLFVLLTLYCLLFRALVLLGAETVWTALICLFFSAVTIGQMTLFRGVRPRAASIVSGALVCPLLLVALSVDEVSTRWTGWTPLAGGLNVSWAFLSATLLLFMVGLGLGYLVGCATAGVFYVLGKVRPSTMLATSEAVGDELPASRISGFATWIGQWINPVQPRRPLRGATATALLSATFGFLVSPFLLWVSHEQVMMVSVALGFSLAVWSGNLQLWILWPIVLTAAGAFAATWAASALQQLPMVENTILRNTDGAARLLSAVRIAGGIVGFTVSALAGWLQWATYRRHENRRFGIIPFVGFVLLLVGMGWLVANRLDAWNRSPTQQLFRKVVSGEGYVGWNLDQTLAAVGLMEDSGDAEFLQLRPLLRNPYDVRLTGSGFTNASADKLEGLHLNSLALVSTSITDAAFENLTDFSAVWVFLHDNEVGDQLVSDLVGLPQMAKMLQSLTMDKTQFTDEGILLLRPCRSLSDLSLKECEISKAGLANLKAIPSLRRLHLAGCPVSDDELETLVTAVPGLTILSLNGTDISDAGLVHLAKAARLGELHLENTSVTPEGIDNFRKIRPSCGVRWNDPRDDGK